MFCDVLWKLLQLFPKDSVIWRYSKQHADSFFVALDHVLQMSVKFLLHFLDGDTEGKGLQERRECYEISRFSVVIHFCYVGVFGLTLFVVNVWERAGNMWTSAAHIVTAVIGSGVLALSWSFAQMGWVAGPIILLAFALCTYYTSRLLADCYRYPDPVTGKRNYIYMDAIKANLGNDAHHSQLLLFQSLYACSLVKL